MSYLRKEELTKLVGYIQTALTSLNTKKAAKATTLNGYGITDASLSGTKITLGTNSLNTINADSTINLVITQDDYNSFMSGMT